MVYYVTRRLPGKGIRRRAMTRAYPQIDLCSCNGVHAVAKSKFQPLRSFTWSRLARGGRGLLGGAREERNQIGNH